MLKVAILVSAAVLSLNAPARADNVFWGNMIVTAATSCPNGPNVHDNYRASFHPKDILGNAAFSAYNIFLNFGARTHRLDSANFTASFQSTATVGIGWSDFVPPKPVFVKFAKQTPTILTAGTPTVTIVGQIKNPEGRVGEENCIASFTFAGVNTVD